MIKTKLKEFHQIREDLAKMIRDNIRDTYWTSNYTGNLWYVKEIYIEIGFFGELMVYLENRSHKFGWWQKFLHNGNEYPTQKVKLKDFLDWVDEQRISLTNVYEVPEMEEECENVE